jgi:outer membrane murein-binding lipoprotein Lpp
MMQRNSGFNVEHAIARTAGTAREMKKLRRMKMEDYRETTENEDKSPTGVNRILFAAVVALIVIAGVAFGYGYRQQIMVSHLSAQESVATTTISDLQGQVSTLTGKMNEMVAAQQAAAQAAAQAEAQKKNTSGKRGAPADKRYKQLQAQLQDQQKQLKDTQDLVAKNRTDLETSLSSTKDELNGSIAKTHEELVVLQKRGERNYFEFDLAKSKQFQRFGPLTLSLRRADAKHMNYDLSMVVDDNQLRKNRVNLYEPIWIHTESEGQPVQVVVNKISKNFVHGYISAPKFKPAELATTGAATVTPAAAHPQTPDQNPESPKQPEQ